jgi:hypothetical protein
VCRYGKLVSTTVRSFRLQEADALDAVQMTWLRLAENAHRVQFPEKLGGWLATTARRECLRILRQAKHSPDLTNMTPETVADPSVGPEQRVIDADTARTLWNLVTELSPRRKTRCRRCSPTVPIPTPRSPARPESRPARSDPPGREPYNSCETNSTNTSCDRKPGDDGRCWPVPGGYGCR